MIQISRREIRERVFSRVHGLLPPHVDMPAARNEEKATVQQYLNWLDRFQDVINQAIDLTADEFRNEDITVHIRLD